MKKKALIIGATGFGGLGLIELLLKHPKIEIFQLTARKDVGKKINEIFPHLDGYINLEVLDNSDIKYDEIDIAFFSTPDQAGMTLIDKFYEKNIPVIDFSGDFRFRTLEEYEVYARNKGMKTEHKSISTLNNSIYGLPELYKQDIQNAKIIGNPGCFAISMILGLLPAVNSDLVDSETIICDGKSGISGAGKNPGEANFYSQRYENINTYREGHHQHVVEVENIVNKVSKTSKKILFIPQVIPMTRGILTTMYAQCSNDLTTDKVIQIYKDYYKDSSFVRISDKSPNTTDVRGSNHCLIRPMVDKRTNTLFITSVIDNLLKGQSGNAIQNANIVLGFEETCGIDHPGFYP